MPVFPPSRVQEMCLIERPSFRLSLAQLKRVESLLKEHQLDLGILELFDFIKAGIEGGDSEGLSPPTLTSCCRLGSVGHHRSFGTVVVEQ